MSSILITGVHGFVGNNLVDSLKNDHSIYGLDIVSPSKEGVLKTFAWSELESIPFVDIIIHLAGKAHDTKNTAQEQTFFDINVGLTQNIFDYFLQSKTSKFIFFSSVKAVADIVNGECLTEESEPKPLTAYGKSKLEAERLISESYSQFKIERERDNDQKKEIEKKIYILRPCMIHGLGNKGNLNLLFKIVSKGIPWPLGAYENRRSFTSIENLQYVIKQLVERCIEPNTYQIADDNPISTNSLIKMIAESKGRKSLIWKINPKLINWLSIVGDKFHLPLNSERLKKLTESYVVSNKRIKKALGIDSMPVSEKEGMQRTLLSFKSTH